MKVEPIVHVIEIALKKLFLSSRIRGVLELIGWRIICEVEPGDVEGQNNSNKVVHLEEKAESTLLKLVNDGKELDHFVHASKTEVNEKQPIDKHEMVGFLIFLIVLLALVKSVLIGDFLKAQCNSSKGKRDAD